MITLNTQQLRVRACQFVFNYTPKAALSIDRRRHEHTAEMVDLLAARIQQYQAFDMVHVSAVYIAQVFVKDKRFCRPLKTISVA